MYYVLRQSYCRDGIRICRVSWTYRCVPEFAMFSLIAVYAVLLPVDTCSWGWGSQQERQSGRSSARYAHQEMQTQIRSILHLPTHTGQSISFELIDIDKDYIIVRTSYHLPCHVWIASCRHHHLASCNQVCTYLQIVPYAGVFAIEILAMCPGGGWRTLSEWKDLFATQSYSLIDLKEVGASMHLMVWEKA